MFTDFFHAVQAERLKTRRSLAAWLVVVGAFFTPAIVIAARLVHHDQLETIYRNDQFWAVHWRNCWESMVLFFLPMGTILATSLIVQLEVKNNAWKQVHCLPLTVSTIFFSKLLIILAMMLQLFVLFNLGVYLSAILPCLLVGGVPYPQAPFPIWKFLPENGFYILDCLPIVALQYLLSLRFKNFMVPIGIGFSLWVAALAALSWKFGYTIPYAYCMLDYLKDRPGVRVVRPEVNIHLFALGYFILVTLVSYFLFATRSEKG